jgi:nucleoside-diphosphate-sugar epimerase
MEYLRASELPAAFRDIEDLDQWLTYPPQALIDDLGRLDGDIMVLGASGKMGPTLARLAKRAAPSKRVVGIARFREKGVREYLEDHGVETMACDFLDRESLSRLPVIKNIIFMAGLSTQKFGQSTSESLTWAMNAHVPAIVCERFANSNIVCFSTGCVYPFVSTYSGGATEQTPLLPPPSNYAYSCVGRERIFEYFAEKQKTPISIVRLNYAIDMRYGVLHDIASKVANNEEIDLATGNVNVIWQGDAAAMALRCLLRCSTPRYAVNVSGPETVSVRTLAITFGQLLGREPLLTGREAEAAWLVNTGLAMKTFGYPRVTLSQLVAWTADWVERKMPSLAKKTQYDARPSP